MNFNTENEANILQHLQVNRVLIIKGSQRMLQFKKVKCYKLAHQNQKMKLN